MKRVSKILIIVSFIFAIMGSTFAYLTWQITTSERTEVTFTITGDFSCSVDGGGNITSGDVTLFPCECTNSKYAIKREIRANTISNAMNLDIDMSLWLDINNLDSGLSNSDNFKYALTTDSDSCDDGVVTSGTFTGRSIQDKISLLNEVTFTGTMERTYYLWIWLDKEETSSSTMDQSFSVSLNGECKDSIQYTYDTLTSNYSCANSSSGISPLFTYTGDCEIVDDTDSGDDNWKIRLLTSGNLTVLKDLSVDVFLVGGGGGGAAGAYFSGGGGGGGGNFSTEENISISASETYEIVIGTGGVGGSGMDGAGSDGESTQAFGYTAAGGTGGSGINPGNGGSGGGTGGYENGQNCGGDGGSDGSNGFSQNSWDTGLSDTAGVGSGISSKEFSTGSLYAGGGGGGAVSSAMSTSVGGGNACYTGGSGGDGGGGAGASKTSAALSGTVNTGGGGGGGIGYYDNGSSSECKVGAAGGSGIVIIRNVR